MAAVRRVMMLPVVILIVQGCAAGISTHVLGPNPKVRTSAPVVLAVMPGTADLGSEWIRSEVASRVSDALAQAFRGVVIVSPEEAAARLTAHGMVEEYAAALDQFEGAGLVDPSSIERIALALEATDFLWLRTGYDAAGELSAATNLNGSPLFYSTKNQRLLTSATLWNRADGAPTWETVVRSESRAGPFSRSRQPFELLDALVHELVQRIPIRALAP